MGPGRLGFAGGHELTDHLGFLHLPGAEERVAGATLDWAFGEAGAMVLELDFLPATSTSLAALERQAARSGFRVERAAQEVSPGLDLPEDFEDYLTERLNKKDRHELRRKLRRIDETVPGWRLVDQSELGLDRALDAFFLLLQRSGEHKRDFLTPEVEKFIRTVSGRFEERGWLRIGLLQAGDRLLAATHGFCVDGTWYLYNSGYDPQAAALSPGLICVAEGIRRAQSEGCRRVDLLRGDEPYKYHLGGQDQSLFQLRISRS